MKEVEINGNKFLLVEVPVKSKDHSVIGVLLKDSTCMLWFNDYYGHDGLCEKILPVGDWQLIGKASDLTEDEWEGIVECDWWYDGPIEEHGLGRVTFYREYPNELEDSCLLSATESGHSLIRSQNMRLETTVILKIK